MVVNLKPCTPVDQASRPKDQKDQAGSLPDPKPSPTLSPGVVPAVGETECYQSSTADGTSHSADMPQASSGTQSAKFSINSQHLSSSHRGSRWCRMVGGAPHELEWEEPNLSANHNDNNL